MKRTWMYGLILVACWTAFCGWGLMGSLPAAPAAEKAIAAWTLTTTEDGHQKLADPSGHWIEFGWEFRESDERQVCEMYIIIYRASHPFCIILQHLCPDCVLPESEFCAFCSQLRADLNGDGVVDLKDFEIFVAMFGGSE